MSHVPQDPKDIYLVGSKVEYTCTEGFHLVGHTTLECTADKTWSVDLGVCGGEYLQAKFNIYCCSLGKFDTWDTVTGVLAALLIHILSSIDPQLHAGLLESAQLNTVNSPKAK